MADSVGMVATPGFPNANYKENVTCIWWIRSSSGRELKLNVSETFDVDCDSGDGYLQVSEVLRIH